MPTANFLDSLVRGLGNGAKRLGERALAKGLDSIFEDAEKLTVEASRRVGRARKRLDAMAKGEEFKDDGDEK
jgi:hypothetical protein